MLMFALTLSLALAAPPDSSTQDKTRALEGNWTIVSIEKNGQPKEDAKQMTVTFKDGTITASGKDGKPAMTWKVDFADQGKVAVKATESDGAAPVDKTGVYVLTNDFLAICLHDGNEGSKPEGAGKPQGAGNEGAGRPEGAGRTEGATGTGNTNSPLQKSYCSIILKREGTR